MAQVYVLPDQRLIDCGVRETLLDAALRQGVPLAHACGGAASCSTCRVLVVEGMEACGQPTAKEGHIAERLRCGPEFRLACQLRPTSAVTVRRLVLDDRDIELADARPAFARRNPSRPIKWLFGGYVRRRLVPRPIGTEQQLAILFADIRGFTSFTEALLPYDAMHTLDRYLRETTTAVEAAGGTISAYMGDGVMALFGVDGVEGAAGRAVDAAFTILEQAERRRPWLEDLYGRSFDVNVGLHWGTAIVGEVCGAGGSVTAIGDAVNMAARIEAANKQHQTRLLLSGAAFEVVRDVVIPGRSWSCELAGKTGSYDVVEVLGRAGDLASVPPEDRGDPMA